LHKKTPRVSLDSAILLYIRKKLTNRLHL
jgi:hypothetical protein